jgi:hypothetical protein
MAEGGSGEEGSDTETERYDTHFTQFRYVDTPAFLLPRISPVLEAFRLGAKLDSQL